MMTGTFQDHGALVAGVSSCQPVSVAARSRPCWLTTTAAATAATSGVDRRAGRTRGRFGDSDGRTTYCSPTST